MAKTATAVQTETGRRPWRDRWPGGGSEMVTEREKERARQSESWQSGIPDSLTLLEPTNGPSCRAFHLPSPSLLLVARSCRLDEHSDNNNNNNSNRKQQQQKSTTTIDNDHDHCLWQTETIENSKFIRWKKLISVASFFFCTFFFCVERYE